MVHFAAGPTRTRETDTDFGTESGSTEMLVTVFANCHPSYNQSKRHTQDRATDWRESRYNLCPRICGDVRRATMNQTSGMGNADIRQFQRKLEAYRDEALQFLARAKEERRMRRSGRSQTTARYALDAVLPPMPGETRTGGKNRLHAKPPNGVHAHLSH